MPDPLDRILHEMMLLHLKFCIPRIVVNTQTGKVTFGEEWVSKEVEQAYNYLGEIVSREQQAAQHSVEPTKPNVGAGADFAYILSQQIRK